LSQLVGFDQYGLSAMLRAVRQWAPSTLPTASTASLEGRHIPDACVFVVTIQLLPTVSVPCAEQIAAIVPEFLKKLSQCCDPAHLPTRT
jgi:hypothetical protein